MTVSDDAMLLRIYMDEGDHWEGRPLYERIVLHARDLKLAGATVLRGPLGYGPSGVHTTKFLQLSQHLPVVVGRHSITPQSADTPLFLDCVMKEG